MRKISFILVLLASIFAVTANAQERGYFVGDFGFPIHIADVEEWERYYSARGLSNPTVQKTHTSRALRLGVGFYPTHDEKHAVEITLSELGQQRLTVTTNTYYGNYSFSNLYQVSSTDASYIGRFNTNGTFRVGYSLLSATENGTDVEELDYVTVNNGIVVGVGYEKDRLRFEYTAYAFSIDAEVAGETYELYSGAGLLSVGYKFNF